MTATSFSELFSVYQFFPDETSECVRQFAPVREAVDAAIHYSTSSGAKLGTTVRVIITDALDNCVWEWTHADGITFPLGSHVGKLKKGIR